MKKPEFPADFAKKHCPRVMEARDWRKHYKAVDFDESDDEAHAQCAFHSAGMGQKCESCSLFLTRPVRTDAERVYLPLIEQYYKEMDAYEAFEARQEAAMKKIVQENGSGI